MMSELQLTAKGIVRAGRLIVNVGRAPAGGIFLVSSGMDRLTDDAVAHVEALLREARTNEKIELGTKERERVCGLTPRETEVLGYLASGFSNKETARRLGMSVRTVETHRLNLRRKTQAGRLKDLVSLARQLGLAPVEAV